MKKLCILLSLVLLAGCAGCFVGCDKTSSDSTSTTEVTEESKIEFYKSDEETFEIKTKYCSLYYPTKWEKSIKTKIDDKEPYSVKFIAVENKEEIPLFDIVFGKSNEGTKLGELKINDDMVEIYLVDNSDKWPESINKDSESNLYGMSEDVNVLISKLVYDSGMVTEK